MKKILLFIVGIFAISLVFTSCLNNDDSTTTYSSDAAITAFSIGTIETTLTTRTYDDSDDSTYTVTLTGSKYNFVIDQKNNIIYNPDSLPYRTNVSKVVTTVTNGGYSLTYRKNEADTVWSSTDSINFTKPVAFKSWAQNGSSRQYTIKINVHQYNPDSLVWNSITSNFKGENITGKQKAVLFKNNIFVYAESNNQVVVTSTSENDGANWTIPSEITGIAEKADYSSAIVFNGAIYILSGTKLYKSEDGKSFSVVASNNSFKRLLAINGSTLWGTNGDNKFVSTSDGNNWNIGNNVTQQLPDQSVSYVNYTQASNPYLYKSVLMGTFVNSTDTIASVWETEKGTDWTPYNERNSFNCPYLNNLSMIRYDSKLYAFGGNSINKVTSVKGFQYFYCSLDEGISWRQVKNNVLFPDSWSGNNNDFSFLVDDNNYIWIIFSKSGPQGAFVWKGQIRRLANDWIYK